MSPARTARAVAAALCGALLVACAGQSDAEVPDAGSLPNATSAEPGAAWTGAAPITEWTGDDMRDVIVMAYDVATGMWDDGERFPVTDQEMERLAGEIAARMSFTVQHPVDGGTWTVTVYRGSYEGAGLTACSDGSLQTRVVVTPDGESIGVAVSDDTDAGRMVYDYARVGVDRAFDAEGISSTAGDCSWGSGVPDAVAVAGRQGTFD